MLLASGRRGKADPAEFADAVLAACEELTLQMARDAEGMTKIARLGVTGAANDAEARIAAKNIAENNLVKCSWYGGDPYWGRLLGRGGIGRESTFDVGQDRASPMAGSSSPRGGAGDRARRRGGRPRT